MQNYNSYIKPSKSKRIKSKPIERNIVVLDTHNPDYKMYISKSFLESPESTQYIQNYLKTI